MPAKQPVHAAGEVARRLFANRVAAGAGPSPNEFFEALREFERVEFDVAEAGDADGLLFQFGPASWLPDPTFVVGVTRQLELVDAAGEHDSYIQVAMEFRFATDPDLDTVGSRSSWWFRGAGIVFSTWLDSVVADPIWQIVSARPVREFVISAEEV